MCWFWNRRRGFLIPGDNYDTLPVLGNTIVCRINNAWLEPITEAIKPLGQPVKVVTPVFSLNKPRNIFKNSKTGLKFLHILKVPEHELVPAISLSQTISQSGESLTGRATD